MTDAMSMRWENFRAELKRTTLHGQQLWREQVPLMIAHIQERCREAAHVGIEEICVDPRALLYKFRPASLHDLPRKVFENKYALDAIWSQLSSLLLQKLKGMGFHSSELQYDLLFLHEFRLTWAEGDSNSDNEDAVPAA